MLYNCEKESSVSGQFLYMHYMDETIIGITVKKTKSRITRLSLHKTGCQS